MNKAIEFRAKEVLTGDWVYGNYVKTPYGHFIVPQNILANELPQYKVDPETVGQFTGAKDKNGRVIFIGDIVKCNYMTFQTFNAQVKFGEYEQDGSGGEYSGTSCIGFYTEAIDKDAVNEYGIKIISDYVEKTSLLEFEWIEVIGNRYDNPDLMEKSS